MRAVGCLGSKFESLVEFSTCSTPTILYPDFFKLFNMLLVSDSYAQSTEFVEPRADFLISLFGGQGVMPQRKIFSIKNASLVLNIAPTLCALLTLSRTMTIGVFLAFLYSSTAVSYTHLTLPTKA